MKKIILILTQEKNNKSVQLLLASLREKLQLTDQYKVLCFSLDEIHLTECNLIAKNDSENIQEVIAYNEIAIAMKRTWGLKRIQALELCQKLAQKGVKIVNGCDFIEWSHSKVTQYTSLMHQQIFPESIILELDKYIGEESTFDHLKFPLIVKKDKGCLADGVYLVNDEKSLQILLADLKSEGYREKLLLQKFIKNPTDAMLSNYYRINIVNRKAQSVVQFQLRWEYLEGKPYQKLNDFPESNDKPMPLSFFDTHQLQNILDVCEFSLDVVGIDIMLDDQKIYLLEMNDGPNISLTEELGQECGNKECAAFSTEIANFLFNLLEQIMQQSPHNKNRDAAARKIQFWFRNKHTTIINDKHQISVIPRI